MRTRVVCIGFLVLLSWSARGQSANIIEVLEKSKAEYPLIRARAAEVNSAKRELNASAFEYIPRISVQHQYTYATSNSLPGAFYPNPAIISPSGGIRAETSNVATWGSFTSALVEWNVFNFGKVAANVSASKYNLKGAEAAYENELFQHQVRTADSYLLALIATRIKSIQQRNVERALRFREAVDAGVRSGLRPGVDSSLAHSEYAKAQILLLESEQNEETNLLRLLELTGSSTPELPTIDSMSFYGTLPHRADTLHTDYMKLHPQLRLANARVNATQARAISIRRSALPSITLVGAAWARGSGVGVDDSFVTDFSAGTKYQVHNYLLGISTRWMLTDLFPTHQKFKSEQQRLVRDTELYREQQLGVQRQVRVSELQYEVAIEQARIAPIQLSAARSAYAQANARYKSGLADLPTLLQSVVTLNRAEADLAVAYSNVWRALLSIAASQGDITIFMNQIN
jgi:outer membrane protein TolC